MSRELFNYHGTGKAVIFEKPVNIEGCQFKKGDRVHAIRNTSSFFETWLLCSGRSRGTVMTTCNLPKFIEAGYCKFC